MKLLRTLRLDRSDTFVFAEVAPSGEWAVPGGFMFWDGDPALLDGKRRAAFRSGFLGVASHGWSTLAEIAEAGEAEHAQAIDALAGLIHRRLGAPDLATARRAAAEEIAFAASLCDHPVGTVIALQRSIDPDGEVRERFRTLKAALDPAANSFAQGCVLPIGVSRTDGQPADAVDEGQDDRIEEVDFIGMMSARADAKKDDVGQ